MFPSLVNCCTIDWFTEWPEEALRSVADFFLSNVELERSIKQGVVDVCVDMQQTAVSLSRRFLEEMNRNYYVTPTSYLELINTFKSLLNHQRSEVHDAKSRYDNGLSKLQKTAEQVNLMEIELRELQPELQKATVETEALLQKTMADKAVANEQSLLVEAETRKCDAQASEAKELKDSCEADLAAAIPALEAAEAALNSLDKKDITEMKAMKKPSAAIKMTMAAISILFGVKPDRKVKDGDPRFDPYWGPATKELLNDPKLIDRLKDFDKDHMDLAVVTKVKTFTDDEEFEPSRVEKKGSVAAAGLARWVHAMVMYDGVARHVAPKRAKLADAEKTLKAAQETLSQKQTALKEVLDKVMELESQLKEASDNKEKLNREVVDCEAKLKRADALIKGLGGEKTRWTKMSENLALTYENVTGDILLSAGVIAYLGAFVTSYREIAVHQWSTLLRSKGITCAEHFSLRETLGNPVQIRSWVIHRLPNDSFSIDNGIMLFRSNRWPLMIDPQGQANSWIKEMEKGNLKVVKQNQGNFVRILENSLAFGTPVLIENVPESLDPILDPILLKQVVVTGGIATIRLGDNTIDYDKNFRLFITTKLSNPHYPPELCVKVNLLNFMATADGLQDQMLGKVVELENEDLERKRNQLVQEDAENQRQLKDIEDLILKLLKNAEGNILDDEVLINTLADSKKTSNTIQERVKQAEHTQQSIAKVRFGYIPVAFQAARLFFCIADLANVDPMYQYSLEWYISLYVSAIRQAPKSKNLEERLHNLNECFTYLLYTNVCRSLFEKDKLLFSFLLTTKILLGKKRIVDSKAPIDAVINSETILDEADLRFFLQGSTSMESAEPNPFPEWLNEKAWNDVLAVSQLTDFMSFKDSLRMNEKWKEVVDAVNPTSTIDAILGDSLSPFKKLCVLRCLRPDVVVPGVQEFIRSQMGTRFIEPPQFDMLSCFNDSRSTTPLIFVLTPGADPMSELVKLAEEKGFSKKLQAISLGQGQGPIAERAVQDASDKGYWVCLQNCHLSTSWMPTLERICEEFSKDTCHEDFRLWLTSEPSASFPPFVLQNGIKMTNEPPKGMRANLLGSLYQLDEDFFECRGEAYFIESPVRVRQFKQILFGLCFFHAAVRERRKFGPLGWNIQYVFSPKDLEISMKQLHKFVCDLKTEDSVPFAALAYLVGECNYGGRVTDDKDRRCIMNILDDFYSPSILEENYLFSPNPIYFSPAPGSLEEYREYVRALPFYEGPEVFGLHENANISCALSETNALLDTALSLQPKSSGGGGRTWGEVLDELAKDILSRIPEVFDIEKALILFPVRYEESMNTVLTQELIRFNRLINEIRTSLVDVQKAIKGLVLLSSELENMGNAMVIGKVPSKWAAVAYPSLKPLGPWVTDLLERIQFLSDWMKFGSPNVYWLSGFFFTQAFITGTLQNFARKYTIPIDHAEFDFKVLTQEEMMKAKSFKPTDGAYVRGLFLEGARWDKDEHVLAESLPRELFISMPFLHLIPKVKEEIEIANGIPELYTGSRQGSAHVYMCPIYKTSFRQGVLSTTGHSTNFVMLVRIPMSKKHEQKHWIKRGVALLTQLDA